jgi:uncharacterized membrane protein (UPF0127 family)
MKHLVYVILIFVYFGLTSCKTEVKNNAIPTQEISFKKEGNLTILKDTTTTIIKRFDIEIAETEYETQTGLMYRNSMQENHGMLFIFNDEKPRSFYMKNTRIALDIIYINSNKKIVSFQENAKPLNESSLPSKLAAKYVLEINAGLVNTLNIEVGDYIAFSKL